MMLSVVACASKDTGGKDSKENDGEEIIETDPAYDENVFEQDGLEDALDFKQQQVTILWTQEYARYCDDIEETNDIVNDALYKRDRRVEERINVKINNVSIPGNWNVQEEFRKTVMSSVQAKDGAYDVVTGLYSIVPSLIYDGYMTDMMELDYFDFDKPWWMKGFKDECAIDGKLFWVSGDISLLSIESIWCTAYNKNLLAELNIEDPVDVIYNGGWTIDYLTESIKNAYADKNGNSEVDDDDQFGYTVQDGPELMPYADGCGIKLTTMDEDNYPQLSINTEKAADFVTKMVDFLWKNKNVKFGLGLKPFTEGRVCFQMSQFGRAKTYTKEMDDAFGFAPLPKWDEEQENYISSVCDSLQLFGILSVCDHMDAVAAAMEAMASESYRRVSPVYYEEALKIKYSKTDDAGKMFDLIRSSLTVNFGFVYGVMLNSLNFQFRFSLDSKNSNWASTCKSNERATTVAIDKLYKTVQEDYK